jgi:hypothetical protein
MENALVENSSSWIAVFSLFIAFLAVFVSPLINSIVVSKQIKSAERASNRQIQTTVKITNREIVAPLRQQWIDNLRGILAEFFSLADLYHFLNEEKNHPQEFFRMTELVVLIDLLLNPNEEPHQVFLGKLQTIQSLANSGLEHDRDNYWDAIKGAKEDAKKILKKEWERVKNEI